MKLSPRAIFTGFLASISGWLAAGDLPEPGKVYQIEDGGVMRTFRVSGNAIGVKGREGPLRARAVPAQTKGTGLRKQIAAAKTSDATIAETNVVLDESGVRRKQGKLNSQRVLTRMVLVKLRDGVDPASVAEEVGATKWDSPAYAVGFHVFHCGDEGAALELMERLRNRPDVLSANALLARPMARKFVPNDSYFANVGSNAGYLWHLRNTGARSGTSGIDLNLTTAWDTVKGTGITIGILDDGVEITHPDLSANYLAAMSYDFLDNDTNPSPVASDDNHGTCVAGIAAAKGNNATGVCGVAPEAGLAGIRIGLDGLDDSQISQAFEFQNTNISVKSSSWGPDDTGDSFEGPGPLTLAALQDAVTNGRGGKGVILTFAAGNGADKGDNSNYDGYANSIYTIAVAGVSDDGLPTYFSEPGANIVVSALGDNDDDQSITTTDRSGTAGYNDGSTSDNFVNTNYTNDFGGTSACAPEAAGVAALLIQKNPNLGWRDVQEILISSAKKNHAADMDWANNAAGYHFNHKYGAGLIDATAAVNAAPGWTLLGAQTSSTITQNELNLAIPDYPNTTGATVNFDFSTQPIVRVEHATVHVTLTHPRRGDLQIVLTSPSGMRSVLAERRDDDNANLDWTFMSVRHWGENSAGTWKLQVVDQVSGNTGALVSASVKLYGTASTAPSGVPAVKSPTTATANVGTPFAYQMTATNAPTSFSATGLPAGLSLNTSTGLISGSPTTAATTNVTLRATNGSGNSANVTLVLTTSAMATLANAVDFTNATWITQPTTTWAINTTPGNSHDGTDSAKPANLTPGASTYMKGFVYGPTVLKFWWRVASLADYDYLDFYVDQETADYATGTVNWTQKTFYIPAGRHLLRWTMSRDSASTLASSTAYLDQITTTDPNLSAPLITSEPQGRYAPEGGKTCFKVTAIGQAPLSYQWKRDGVNVTDGTQAELLLEPVPAGNATYTCVVTNTLGNVQSTGAALVVTGAGASANLSNALDNTKLGFGTAATNGWFRQTTETTDGIDALRSGAITHLGSTALQTCVTGPALLKFNWKVGSETNGDYLDLLMDDAYQTGLTGSVTWAPYSLAIPAGNHVIEWNYNKDDSVSTSPDAGFVDAVSFQPTGYAAWKAVEFTAVQRNSPNTTGALDDPDQDKIPNLVEYALGLSPNAASASGLPAPVQVGNNLEFTYTENIQLQDILYVPETSSNLSSWTPIAATQVSLVGDARTMKVTVPVGSGDAFIRLRVTEK